MPTTSMATVSYTATAARISTTSVDATLRRGGDAFPNLRVDRLIAIRGTGEAFRHERCKRFADYLEAL